MKHTVSKKLTLAVLVIAGMGVAGFTPDARADWNLGDSYKMHYPQLPDLTPSGLDVLATINQGGPNPQWKILADDFGCTQTGPISDIHIWGSWLNNHVGFNTAFKLSIHADDRTGPFSKPGVQLWSFIFSPGQYSGRLYADGTPEQFFDPNQNVIIGSDNQVWQYNFVNIPTPFIQQQGTIYWLDVQAIDPDPLAVFGWKTTNPLQTPHFEDDGVFADTAGFNGTLITPWTPLVYPLGHQFAGQSMDLAFVITVPEPNAAVLSGLAVGLLVLLARRRK